MRIEEYLRENGLTIAAFAERIGVSEAAMGRYIAGKRTPRRDILARIMAETGGQVRHEDILTVSGAGEGIAEWLERHPEIEAVDLLLFDLNGLARGKRVERAAMAKVVEKGVRLPASIYALDTTGENVPGTGLVWRTGDADFPVLPASADIWPVPWAAQPVAQVLMRMEDGKGRPIFADPRAVLERAVKRLNRLGLRPVVAVELEFYLLDARRRPGQPPKPPRSALSGRREASTQVYSLDDVADYEAFFGEVTAACRAQDIPADTVVAEYAPGQFEVNLRHTAEVARACDHSLMLKRTIRAIARKHGMIASFAAKPYAELSGSGQHVHVSLLDRDGGNALRGPHVHGGIGLSDTALHALAGLQAHMADSMLAFAPNANSYRRFQAGSYAPLAPTWGVDNRTVALRIPGEGGAATRIEHRVAGADANPYILVTALLGAMAEGIEKKAAPGQRITGNAYEQVPPSLPASWEAGLAAFADSPFIERCFGADFQRLYHRVKAEERAKFERIVTPTEYDWYVDVL